MEKVCSVPKVKSWHGLMQTHVIGFTPLIFRNFVVMEIYDHVELFTTLFYK